MSKTETQNLFPAKSESIEPAFAHIIGVMYCRFKHTIDNEGDVVEAAYDFWSAVEAMNLLTITLGNATHASIAISNHKQTIASMIENATGLDPILDHKNLKLIGFTNNFMNWYKRHEELKV